MMSFFDAHYMNKEANLKQILFSDIMSLKSLKANGVQRSHRLDIKVRNTDLVGRHRYPGRCGCICGHK